MEKIIIQNESDLEWADVLKQVRKVIKRGRISGDGASYCYLTRVMITDQLTAKTYSIYASRNKNSDKFKIM